MEWATREEGEVDACVASVRFESAGSELAIPRSDPIRDMRLRLMSFAGQRLEEGR